MRISRVIENMQRVMDREGDVETTCTASALHDGFAQNGGPIPDVYESTVENFQVVQADDKLPKRVRIYF